MSASAAAEAANGGDSWRVTAAEDEPDGVDPYSDWVPMSVDRQDELAPPLALVESLYSSMAAKGGVAALSLLWRCPGRVTDTAAASSTGLTGGGDGSIKRSQDRSAGYMASEDDDETEEIHLPDMSDFDFAGDELAAAATPAKTPRRREPGAALRGSARKKSTNFQSILKNMKRTREMEAREALHDSGPRQ